MSVDYWKIVLNIWSITWLIAFLYTTMQVFRTRPRFKFRFAGMQWNVIHNGWMDFYKLYIAWTIKNQSLSPNSINVIHTVVWENKSNYSVLRHSTWVKKIISKTDDDQELHLPILLNWHEAKHLEITSEFPINWTPNEHILSQHIDVWWWFTLPKYEYKLLFEDTNENIFDENGNLCNMEESWLRFTLGNTIHSLKIWKPWEFINHYLKIVLSKIKFRIKKILLYIWLRK